MRVKSVCRCNWSLSISPMSPRFSILMREQLIMKRRNLAGECAVISEVLVEGFGREYAIGEGYLANQAAAGHVKI